MPKHKLKEFIQFQDSFKDWQYKFGLTQYRTDFYMQNLKDSFACIEVNEIGKLASVTLCDHVEPAAVPFDNLEDFGQHEVIHLLLSRLLWLYSSLGRNDKARIMLDEEEEAVVRRIQTVLNAKKGTK